MIEKLLKRIIIHAISLSFVLFIILPNHNLRAQCDPGSLSRECINTADEGLIYLKSYSVDGQDNSKGTIEYTAVMSKGMQYVFKICTANEGADGIILKILDSNRNEITSNQQASVIDHELNYLCTSTGIYYLRFTFHESRDRCGGCILSLKNNQD
jgi:hypothetical protein